jgi:hypothetical protein
MKSPRVLWVMAPLLIGAGLLLLLLRGLPGPDLPETAPLGGLPSSSLTVRVAYGLAGLAGELEAELPLRFGGLQARQRYPGDERLEYAFEAERGPLELTAVGDTVRVVTELGYGGQVWYGTPLGVELTTSCGIEAGELAVDAPRATIEMSFPILVDELWTVRSAPTVDRVEPSSASDRCLAAVLGFEVDATEAIMTSLREWLEDEAASVGAQIESVSPRPYAEEWWAAVQGPIELASDVWLVLEPEALSYRIGEGGETTAAGPSAGTSAGAGPTPASITGEVGATVRPRVVLGSRPATSLRALPPLGVAFPPGADSTSEWVTIEAVVGFGEASEIVAAGLEGVEWQGLGRTVRVVSAGVSGEGEGRAALTLELAGDATARIRLVGTPVLDASGGEVSVPDLDVALESGGPLPRVLVWATRSLFPGVIRRRARFPLEPLLSPGLEEGVEVPLSDGATLDASLTEVEVTDLVTTEGGFVVRARIRPEARFRIDS